jgi:hypothetical protein
MSEELVTGSCTNYYTHIVPRKEYINYFLIDLSLQVTSFPEFFPLIFCMDDLYFSPSIIRIIKARRMRLVGHAARMGENSNSYGLLVGKPEGRRPLGRPRRRWLDNIKMDLVEVGWSDVDWIGLAQDRGIWRALVNSVLNLQFP